MRQLAAEKVLALVYNNEQRWVKQLAIDANVSPNHIMKGVRARGDIMMISLCRRYSLFISMLLFLTAEISSAAEVRTTASQEWDSIVKRAEEEGQVAVYATDSIGNAQMIWAAFQKRYPKIKLVGTSLGRGSDLFPKLFGERRAGKFLADVFLGAPSSIYLNLYRAKIVEPIAPLLIHPEVTHLSKWWMGKHHYIDSESQYVFMYESALYGPPIAFNTNLINEKEIKSAWDLVLPQWPRKVSGTPSRSGAGVHGSHLRLLSSSARAKVYRTYLSRYGAHVFPRHPPGHRLVIAGKIRSLLHVSTS